MGLAVWEVHYREKLIMNGLKKQRYISDQASETLQIDYME